MGVRPVTEAASVAAVQEVVRTARAGGFRLRVVGAGHVERFEQRAIDTAEFVSMRRLGCIEIAARDFTAWVGAGVTLVDLDAALRPLGLVWPLRRLEASGTVGGLIASGRATTSTAQDRPGRRWVLGARLVDGTGEVLTVGGATVKNSMGYGVTHALWGSQGRLAAMVGLTLRVRRRRAEDDEACQTLEREALGAAAALVRCDDLAPGTEEQAVAGLSGAIQAACSSDGLRAVGCYAKRGAAEADAAGLCAQGIKAQVEPRGDRRVGSAALATARAGLDPDGVFV